tara:strand:+ start:4943 stop:5071 length:129 start_codon:yes stop_codon:yes gene_type:complete
MRRLRGVDFFLQVLQQQAQHRFCCGTRVAGETRKVDAAQRER